ncbi:armadillo-type protein [Mycena sanguinolenta]|nr:armadillo-type protein [Mycena sanguinolenta]
MGDVQAVLAALAVFQGAPDKASLNRANTWLQDFQHSPDAWATCNALLLTPDVPVPAQVFAAQTFRAKVTYDLHQVDAANLPGFRDTIVAALQRHRTGPKTVIVQLCLAIAGLAMQFPSWTNAVQFMIDSFGRNPETVPVLLEFLTILPEELNNNHKIPITDDEYLEREAHLLTANAKQVLELLSLYIQATGVTHAVQSQVFGCLRSWLIAGEVRVTQLVKSPLFAYAFEALASDSLFDSAVDVICELIHETQEIDDNMPAIELIVPRLIALKPQLVSQRDEPEKIKGYARVFSEAGETYRMLLLQHPETFFPIVEAIGECSAYPDLDIVPITFSFWMRLAQTIGKKPSVSPLFLEAYRALVQVIISHLHFPSESTSVSAQEAEDFRSFRHVMGDTLKDCCLVLRTDTCLLATYQMITTALSRGPEAVSWQEVEAPLFAMRSMGAELDLSDNDAIPKIMALIPSLPNHPRVRYAALLIISRYTEWANLHPEFINAQLQYVSAGFEDPDSEVCGAAGQALKYLCQDCKQHLVEFLPQLHTFLLATGAKLVQDDRRQVYEAIAYVISAMPMAQAAESLRTFSVDILARIHAATNKTSITKQELEDVGDGLENLEVMLHVIQGFGEELPPACQTSCRDAWDILDLFLVKYGADYDMAERTTRVIRHGITLFGNSALPMVPFVVARMSFAFEATGYPSYLWIAGKLIQNYGGEEDADLRGSFREVYERSTNSISSLLQSKSPSDIPDVIEDYLRMLASMVTCAPDIFFESSAFPLAFRTAMAAMTLIHTDIIFASLDLFSLIFTHECLNPDLSTAKPPKFPIYSSAIQAVVEKNGFQFLSYLLGGLVGDFPEDSTAVVVSIFRAIAVVWGSQLLSWLPSVLQQLPISVAPQQVQAQFLSDVSRAVNDKEYDKVKYAILALNRSSRKARERRRTSGLDR